MIRQSPTVPARRFLAPALCTFVLAAAAACGERQPQDEPTALEAQLGGGPSADCSPTPCVVVEVTEKGNKPPTDEAGDPINLVVTLVQGGTNGNGPFDQSASELPLVKLTDNNGIATFDADDFELVNGGGELGYCAHVRPLTDVPTALGGTPGVVPNDAPPPVRGGPLPGAVSTSATKSEILNKSSYVDNCLSWTDASSAPFSLTSSDALPVSLELPNTGSQFDVTCRLSDGDTENDCGTWGIIDLSQEFAQGLMGWIPQALVDDGVVPGLLVSAARRPSDPNVESASLTGLPPDEFVQIESADEVVDEAFTASLQDKVAPTTSGKGSNETGGTQPLTANFEPLVCVANTEPTESEGEVVEGVDFLDPVTDGYLAASPLNQVTFGPNAERVTIFYDQVFLGGDGVVKLRTRAKQNPDLPDDGLATTLSKTVRYDFSPCPDNPPTFVSEVGDDEIVISAPECRAAPEAGVTQVKWSITIPETRLLEWRADAFKDTHPETSRDDDTRSMRKIDLPDSCPLTESSIGTSNDPKFWPTG